MRLEATALLLFATALLFSYGALTSASTSKAYQSDGSKKMAARLDEIIRSTRIEESPYMNREKAQAIQRLLRSTLDQRVGLKLRVRLVQELLLAGDTEDALKQLRDIRDTASNGVAFSREFDRQMQDLETLAYLRLGEQENCVLHGGIESCLLPIRGSGVHQRQRGSRQAIKGLTAVLQERPNDLLARWLLNIAYMTIGEHPGSVPSRWLIPADSFNSEYDITRFPDVAPQLGLNIRSLAGGSIMEDFDRDGNLDIMASSSGLRDQLRLFRNNGDGTFTEKTMEAGLAGLTGGLNIVQTDYNNDGFPDVLVLRGAWMGSQGHYPNSLLRNNGNGTFDDVTEEAGLLSFHPTQVGVWADFDRDGWLDVFIGNESKTDDPNPSELYRNNGDGTFTNVASRMGVADLGFVKGAAWGDYDNDGYPDLYISRLGAPNILLHNERGRGFRDVTKAAGVAEPIHSFATWFWDYDNDGWEDLFVAGFQTTMLGDIAAVHLGSPSGAERPRLYRNNGNGTFTDTTASARLDRVVLVMGANFGDLDNDGFLDCYFGTGEPDLRALLPNRMFRNAGGRLFQDVTTSGGFGHLQKGHGISFGDIDNDGDQDIYQVMGGAYEGDAFRNVLYRNPGHGNDWITLLLEGTRSNRAAIGARIKVVVDSEQGTREIHATVSSGGSFGASSLQAEIGLGKIRRIRQIDIQWPRGLEQRFDGLAKNTRYILREGDAQARPRQGKRWGR
jgi:hypothetical protein